MGKTYGAITPEHQAFIEQQPLFFVASAPLSGSGHVNLSPKGLDSFRVLDPNTVMLLGSHRQRKRNMARLLETVASPDVWRFQGNPKILRLYCHGRVLTRSSAEWTEAVSRFAPQPGIRQIVVGAVLSVQTSCGFGVPLMTLVEQRDQLPRWAESKGAAGWLNIAATRTRSVSTAC